MSVATSSNINIISTTDKPFNIYHTCSALFRSLADKGNCYLSYYSIVILRDLLGRTNRAVIEAVLESWLTNETSEQLAKLYRLNQYVSWFPRIPEVDDSSYWAGLWKAWWNSCFWERKIWGDDIDDLLSCLQQIMMIMYRGIFQKYAMTRHVIRKCPSDHNPRNVISREQIVAIKVMRKDSDICKYLGSARDTDQNLILGYLATAGLDIMIFEMEKSTAESLAFDYAKCGFKGMIPLDLSKLNPEVVQRNISLIHYPPTKIANSLRQRCFDLFVEICFGNPQPLSNLDLTQLLRGIQHIRREMLQHGTCPVNHLARVFFYEVSPPSFPTHKDCRQISRLK